MIKKYASYRELKEAKTKLYNDFSSKYIHWIFASTDEKLAEELKKLGLNRDDVLSIGMGGYLKKEALSDYKKLLKELGNMWDEIKDDDKLLKSAFKYELANREYCITEDLGPTLDALNVSFEEINNDKRILKILKDAIREYMDSVIY